MAFEWVSYFWGNSNCNEEIRSNNDPDGNSNQNSTESWFWVDVLHLASEDEGFIVVGKTLDEGYKNESTAPSYAEVLKRNLNRDVEPFQFNATAKKLEKLLHFPKRTCFSPVATPTSEAHWDGVEARGMTLQPPRPNQRNTVRPDNAVPPVHMKWRGIRVARRLCPGYSRALPRLAIDIHIPNTIKYLAARQLVLHCQSTIASPQSIHKINTANMPGWQLQLVICPSQLNQKRLVFDPRNAFVHDRDQHPNNNLQAIVLPYSETHQQKMQQLAICWHPEFNHITVPSRVQTVHEVVGRYVGKVMTVATYLATRYICSKAKKDDFKEETSATKSSGQYNGRLRCQFNKRQEASLRNAQLVSVRQEQKAYKHAEKQSRKKQLHTPKGKRSNGRLTPQWFSGRGGMRAC